MVNNKLNSTNLICIHKNHDISGGKQIFCDTNDLQVKTVLQPQV